MEGAEGNSMSWVKVDDKAWSHPKFSRLSAPGVRLWLFAMCWCNQHETDGTISRADIKVIGGTPRVASELVEAGLWVSTPTGWAVHDFLKYQPSHEQREKDRVSAKDRAARSYERYAGSASEESRKNEDPAFSLHAPRPDPIPNKENGKREPIKGDRKKPNVPFPDGLVPLPRQVEKAKSIGVNCALQFSKFSNFHISKGNTFADWHRAFDTWLGNAEEFASRDGRKPQVESEFIEIK